MRNRLTFLLKYKASSFKSGVLRTCPTRNKFRIYEVSVGNLPERKRMKLKLLVIRSKYSCYFF